MNINIENMFNIEVTSMSQKPNENCIITGKTPVYRQTENGGLDKEGTLYVVMPNVDLKNKKILLDDDDYKFINKEK